MIPSQTIKFIAIAAFLVSPVLAHHSTATNFNRDSIISVEGVVTEFKFQNPHVQVLLMVINESGEVEHWTAEMSAKNQLVRSGWKGDEISAGEQITVTGWEGYRERSVFIQSAVKGDGTELAAGRILTER